MLDVDRLGMRLWVYQDDSETRARATSSLMQLADRRIVQENIAGITGNLGTTCIATEKERTFAQYGGRVTSDGKQN